MPAKHVVSIQYTVWNVGAFAKYSLHHVIRSFGKVRESKILPVKMPPMTSQCMLVITLDGVMVLMGRSLRNVDHFLICSYEATSEPAFSIFINSLFFVFSVFQLCFRCRCMHMQNSFYLTIGRVML